jgi:signal transduction histidine kinase
MRLRRCRRGGGLVGVRTSHVPDDHDVLIEVADNGPGMTPETAGRMMTAGAAADGRPWSGLALARAIAEKHGGRLDLLSRPGQGTIVQIRLPQHRELTGASRPIDAG